MRRRRRGRRLYATSEELLASVLTHGLGLATLAFRLSQSTPGHRRVRRGIHGFGLHKLMCFSRRSCHLPGWMR